MLFKFLFQGIAVEVYYLEEPNSQSQVSNVVKISFLFLWWHWMGKHVNR